MCRIAGIIDPALQPEEAAFTVKQMCDLLQHGGPDDEGIFALPNDNLVLGNRRLSLLDLSAGGHQPMHYSHRYTITYNGELYNYKALKNELISLGRIFRNETDTEVILAAFAEWNIQSFTKLNGMFAFAIWDNKEKSLFIVRDAAGIKPLYYSTSSGAFAFSSEIRGFAPIEYLQEKNASTEVYMLAYGHIPEPVTTLTGVQPLPKGCFIKYNALTKEHSLQSFGHFSYSNRIKSKQDAESVVRTAVADAVERQMVADAPLGIFLSGGIDSSVLAKLADRQGAKMLNTLSIHFEDKKYSEKKYQDAVAAEINGTHHSFLLKEKDFTDAFGKIKDAMDMPSGDGINTWFISKFASALGLKAVLSGIGGDELFGGYPSFKRMKAALFLQQSPSKLLQLTATAGVKKMNRAAYLRLEGIKGIYLFLRGYFTPAEIARQLDADEKEVWQILHDLPPAQPLFGLGAGNTAGWMEFNMYMQNQLLRDADVMGMANGLEIRVPFLDNEVIRPVMSVSEDIKYKGDIPKQFMIDCFHDMLPETVWNRKKMGFGFPFTEWLRNTDELKVLGASKNKHTRALVKDFLEGRVHWSRVMAMMVLK